MLYIRSPETVSFAFCWFVNILIKQRFVSRPNQESPRKHDGSNYNARILGRHEKHTGTSRSCGWKHPQRSVTRMQHSLGILSLYLSVHRSHSRAAEFRVDRGHRIPPSLLGFIVFALHRRFLPPTASLSHINEQTPKNSLSLEMTHTHTNDHLYSDCFIDLGRTIYMHIIYVLLRQLWLWKHAISPCDLIGVHCNFILVVPLLT